MEKRVAAAQAAYESAARNLMAAVKEAYPIGTDLIVEIRSGVIKDCRVVEHGSSWWSEPSEFFVENLETGAVHRVFPSMVKLCPST